jgi:hypothetical protein
MADMMLTDEDRMKAKSLANPKCLRCNGKGIQVMYDDLGLQDPACVFSVEDFCDCTEKNPDADQSYNWTPDCKLCFGEGLIRGIDFGAGAGDREYVWDFCDCDAGAAFENKTKFEF